MTDANTHKVVLITGASSGIGEATARLQAHKGLQVVLGARRTDRLEAIAFNVQLQRSDRFLEYLSAAVLDSMRVVLVVTSSIFLSCQMIDVVSRP